MTHVTIQIVLTSGTSYVQNLQKSFVRRRSLPSDAWKYARVTIFDPEGIHSEFVGGKLVKLNEPVPKDAIKRTVTISNYPLALSCVELLASSYSSTTHEHLIASSLLARLLRIGGSPLLTQSERAYPMHFLELPDRQ